MDVIARLVDEQFPEYSVCQNTTPNLALNLSVVYIHERKFHKNEAPSNRMETPFSRFVPRDLPSVLQLVIIPVDPFDRKLPITTPNVTTTLIH